MPDTAIVNQADHQRLFSDLGRELGIDGVAFNEAGICVMSFDDVVLRFEYQSERDEILASSVIGEMPSISTLDMLSELFVLNAASMAAGGGTVGIDPNSDVLIWLDRLSPRGLSHLAFRAWIEAAITRHEFWQSALARLRIGSYERAEEHELAAIGLAMIRV